MGLSEALRAFLDCSGQWPEVSLSTSDLLFAVFGGPAMTTEHGMMSPSSRLNPSATDKMQGIQGECFQWTPGEFYTLYIFLQDWLWMWVCYRKCTMGSALRDSKYCKFASNSGLWVSCYAHTKFCMNLYKLNYGLSAVKPSGINHWSHLGLSFARGVHSEFCDSMGESPLFLLSISFSILTLSVSQTSSEISSGWFWF